MVFASSLCVRLLSQVFHMWFSLSVMFPHRGRCSAFFFYFCFINIKDSSPAFSFQKKILKELVKKDPIIYFFPTRAFGS